MKKCQMSLVVVMLVFWLSGLCQGQEQPMANKSGEPPALAGSDAKKESPNPTAGIIDALKAEKEKYQKAFQEEVNKKIDFIDKKLKEVRSLTEESQAESKGKPGAQGSSSAKQTAERELSPSGDKARSAALDLWGKIIVLLETLMEYWEKISSLVSFLFK